MALKLNKLYDDIVNELRTKQEEERKKQFSDPPKDAIDEILEQMIKEEEEDKLADKQRLFNENTLKTFEYMKKLIENQKTVVGQQTSNVTPPSHGSGYVSSPVIQPQSMPPQTFPYISSQNPNHIISGAPQSGVKVQSVKAHVDDALNEARKVTELTPSEVIMLNSLKSVVESRVNSLGISSDMKTYNGLILAGGCFTSIYYNEEVNDYDLFILDGTIASERMGSLMEALEGRAVTKNSDYVYKNPNIKCVYTQKDVLGGTRQYIFSKFDNIRDLLNDFDLKHSRVAYDGKKLYISPSAFRAMITKTLIPHKEKPPYSPRMKARFQKFLKRGYFLGPGITL